MEVLTMARKRMVTRSINEVKVTAMCCDITTASIVSRVFTLGGNVAEGDELKTAQKLYDTETLKVVSLTCIERREVIYGMLETEFLKYAKVMTDDRKFID